MHNTVLGIIGIALVLVQLAQLCMYAAATEQQRKYRHEDLAKREQLEAIEAARRIQVEAVEQSMREANDATAAYYRLQVQMMNIQHGAPETL